MTKPPEFKSFINRDMETPSPRRLENRVATLEEEVDRLRSDNGFIRDAIMAHVERYDAMIAELQNPTPDQPAAPRIDPRPWRTVADAYDEAYQELDDPMNFHNNDSRVAGVKAAVAKAVELGLVNE